MKLKEIQHIHDTLLSVSDFINANTDSDESGIGEEMNEQISKAEKYLDDEKKRIWYRNASARIRRKRK